ncbi:MAG: haloacid dehalogenase type II, partial [Gemmatimonadaceae bacterium]
ASIPQPRFRAVVFDGFPIFDPRPISALAEELFPGKGAELINTWRTRQFEYTWLRTIEKRYVDFRQVTEDALVFAAKSMKLDLNDENRARLVNGYSNLKAWPDVRTALDALRSAGVRIGFLTNFSEAMLNANIKSAGLDGYFEKLLSTDLVHEFKPAPTAYQMGVDAFQLPKENILFAAFAGWDAAGAKSFGYPTFWVNRLNAPTEELGNAPDGVGGMAELVKFVLP